MQVACQNLGPLGKGGVVVGIDTKVVSFSYVSPLVFTKRSITIQLCVLREILFTSHYFSCF